MAEEEKKIPEQTPYKEEEKKKIEEQVSKAAEAEKDTSLWDTNTSSIEIARTYPAARLSTNLKWIQLAAYRHGAQVHIKVRSTYGSPLVDYPTSLEDVGSTTVWPPNVPLPSFYSSTNGSTPQLHLAYNTSYGAHPLSTPYAQERTIKITFASGYTKIITVLVPGYLQKNPGSSMGNGSVNSLCDPTDGYEWDNLNEYSTVNSPPHNIRVYTHPETDPAGVYADAVAVYTTQSAMSSSISFDFRGAAHTAIGAANGLVYPNPGTPSRNHAGEQELHMLGFYTTVTGATDANNGSQTGMYQTQKSGAISGNIAEPFIFLATFAHELIACGGTTAITYYVCGDVGSPDYYLTSGKDCNNSTIPAGALNGTTAAIFDTSTNCCPNPCTLEVSITTEKASFNTSNGIITVNMEDTAFPGTASGTPWTSGSQYTVTITHSAGNSIIQSNPPVGGATYTKSCTTNITAGTEHQVTVTSDITIATGMQVSGTGVPASTFVGNISSGLLGAVVEFELVDSTGSTVLATAAATNTLTFATGLTHSFGSLPATVGSDYYTLTVLDNRSGGSCTLNLNTILRETSSKLGCTNTNAINYDATAQAMCAPDCCIICDAITGELSNPLGNYTGDLFVNALEIPQGTTNSVTSDGSIFVQADVHMAIVPYIQLTTQTYTMTLYPLTVAGDFTTAGAATTTSAGLTVASNGTSPAENFINLAYGHYATKIQIVDSDEALGLEDCYTIIYSTVKTKVCDDPTATNYNTSVPAGLFTHDASLCTYPVACCQLSNIAVAPVGCGAKIGVNISCTAVATSVVGNWELNGTVIPGAGFSLGSVSSLLAFSLDPQYVTDPTGIYTVNITATYGSGQTCNQSLSILASGLVPVCGCTDPTALNYDPSATIDDGSCIYPTWDCVTGNCVGINTGLGQYASLSACQTGCTPPPYGGCTDSCATNYDPNAGFDDGSCTYKACLDVGANNYQYSCDCGQVMPSATIHDASCCFFPCLINPTITAVTTDATGTCTSSVADGSVTVSIVLNNTAATWNVEYEDTVGNTLYSDPVYYSGNTTAATYSGLAPGVYFIGIIDSFGCYFLQSFSIGINDPGAGCTDPHAENYDPTATCDDGSCIYCGCTDILATNYNPNASCDDGSCEYTIVDSPCLPADLDKKLEFIDYCLSTNGSRYLDKLKVGTADDCSIMNNWKLIFVKYLLNKKGLSCLYNCSDGSTPDLATTLAGISCDTGWTTGGPVTGLADQSYVGSSIATGGTTVANPSLFFVAANTLYSGDVIKMPSGYIWKVSASAVSCTHGCYNPETAQGAKSGNWEFCNDAAHTITITDSTNYLDNFINFVNKFCEDCEIENTTTWRGKGGVNYNINKTSSSNISQNGINFNI